MIHYNDTLGIYSSPYLSFSLSSIVDGKVGLFLAFVEVSMGGRNASGSQRERERRDRETACVKMTEEVWANTDAKPCMCLLTFIKQLNYAGRQVLAQQKGACVLNLCFHL